MCVIILIDISIIVLERNQRATQKQYKKIFTDKSKNLIKRFHKKSVVKALVIELVCLHLFLNPYFFLS